MKKKLLKLRTLTKSVLMNSKNTYQINVKLVDGFFKMIYLLTRAVSKVIWGNQSLFRFKQQ